MDEKEFGLVPVENAKYTYGLYSSFSTFCSNPEKQYSFLIDEEGLIYKCSFGTWDYVNVNDYKTGGFAERFKEFNMKFYNVFISNCKRYNESYLYHSKK